MNIGIAPFFSSIVGKRKLNLLLGGGVLFVHLFIFNTIKCLHILYWEIFHSPPPPPKGSEVKTQL